MSSSIDELADEATELAAQAAGAGFRFDDACRKVAARDMRGRRRSEAEQFFESARATVEAARASPEGENGRERQRTSVLVFMSRKSVEGGPSRIEVTAESAESKRTRDLILEREEYALPEEMFWDFSEWFKDGIASGAFDSSAAPEEKVPELIYAEFKGASKSWLDRKGWENVSEALKSLP